jgi:hypothetical protein
MNKREVREMGKKIRKELNKTIKTVSKKIRRDEIAPEYRTETLKALALMVKARARMK